MRNNDWLDIDVLEDYLDGKLDAKAMHRVERLSLEDPFVAEALAGLSLSPKRVQSLSLLQKQLQDRIAQKPVQEKRWQITSQRLSIAAAAAVLFVTVSLLFWMRESNNREQVAANTPKKVDVAIAATQEPALVKANKEVEKVIAKAAIVSVTKSPDVSDKQRLPSPAITQKSAVSPDNTALNEVVIVGAYGAKQTSRSFASKVFIRPEPVNGWDKFDAYVLENNKLLVDKKLTGRLITVYFELDKEGNPINLKTINTFKMVPNQTEAEEQEAIRLVKEGPKWFLPPNSGSSPTNTSVNIRF